MYENASHERRPGKVEVGVAIDQVVIFWGIFYCSKSLPVLSRQFPPYSRSHASIPAMNINRFYRRKSPSSRSLITSTEEAAADLARNDQTFFKSPHRNQNKKKSPSPSPRLHRTNAVKRIDYVPPDERYYSHSATRSAKSPDIFRIDGESEGMLADLCQHLELSSPDDLGISVREWEEQKLRTKSDVLPLSHALDSVSDRASSSPSCLLSSMVSSDMLVDLPKREEQEREKEQIQEHEHDQEQQTLPSKSTAVSSVVMELSDSTDGTKGGIKVVHPTFLAPPPVSISNLQHRDRNPGWDIMASFDHQDENGTGHFLTLPFESEPSILEFSDQSQLEDKQTEEGISECRLPEFSPASVDINSSDSLMTLTSTDDDCSISSTEQFSSPNKASTCNISSWNRGSELGRGSYGTVFLAMTSDGSFLAVKEVSLHGHSNDEKQCIQQLEQEIGLLKEFEHENIVQYMGTDKDDKKLYIFLELVSHGSLESLYHQYELRDTQVSAYTRQILNGLNYLHKRKVVHRDIKCSNILVTSNGSVKLADFGLAKQTSKSNGLLSCKGSVYWMAPEVINNKRNGGYGSKADIWSLGCTVLEMLTRKPPYSNFEWQHAMFQIGRGVKPDIPDSLSKDATDFICRCIQVNPDDRPTASELFDDPFVRMQLPCLSTDSSSQIDKLKLNAICGQ